MIESLHCFSCNHLITSLHLSILRHVELECPECGAWNEYDYQPEKYVRK